MKVSEYQECVKRTCAATEHEDIIKLALIGMAGELGEIAEPLKKYLWGDHSFARSDLKNEIGDLLWYLATLCNTFNIDLEQVMQLNIEKLQRRYPDGFSAEMSQHRKV